MPAQTAELQRHGLSLLSSFCLRRTEHSSHPEPLLPGSGPPSSSRGGPGSSMGRGGGGHGGNWPHHTQRLVRPVPTEAHIFASASWRWGVEAPAGDTIRWSIRVGGCASFLPKYRTSHSLDVTARRQRSFQVRITWKWRPLHNTSFFMFHQDETQIQREVK